MISLQYKSLYLGFGERGRSELRIRKDEEGWLSRP